MVNFEKFTLKGKLFLLYLFSFEMALNSNYDL